MQLIVGCGTIFQYIPTLSGAQGAILFSNHLGFLVRKTFKLPATLVEKVILSVPCVWLFVSTLTAKQYKFNGWGLKSRNGTPL